jgi:peptide/nickel transport system permease protein
MRVSRLVRGNAGGILGLTVAVVTVAIAIVTPLVAPCDPLAIDFAHKLQAPSRDHPFGTDIMGRDILSRVLHGTRISLSSAAIVLIVAIVVGSLVGSVAAFFGGALDHMLMRMTDIFLAFPFLVLAMAIAAAMGPALIHALLAVAAVWWTSYARLVRGLVLSTKHNLFVEAAHAIGASTSRVIVRHVLPNCFGPLLAKATVDIGYAILATASLSFVGLGAQPPTPEWGAMVAEGRTYIINSWWIASFPGLAIFVTVLGFSLLGDAIQEQLPR